MTRTRTAGTGRRIVSGLLLISAMASAVPAGGAASRGTAMAAATRALERWDMAAAGDALAQLPPDGDPAMEWTRGIYEFYAGDYEKSLRHLERAEGRLPEGMEHEYLAGLVRGSLKMKSALRSYESEHFVLSLDPEKDWVLAAPALETLEKAYQELGSWLGHFPEGRVRVEIVPSAPLFEEVSSLTVRDIKVSGAIGICKFNKIMLLSPRLLLKGYRWRDSLAHEYAHYLLVNLSANGAPIWLQEGVARYGESLWRSNPPDFFTRADEGLVAEALSLKTIIDFETMHPSLVRLPSATHVRLAFAECALAVDYLLSRWEVKGLRNLLARLGDGTDLSPALVEATGLSLAEFEAEWLRHLESKSFRPLEGLEIRELRMATEGGGEDDGDLERWQSLEGQRHVKLGDMLRKRKRYGAALREYDKALKTAPASPFVLNRMAGTLMAMERYEEAGVYLLRADEIHPGYADTYSRLASLRAVTGDWNGAEEALNEYLDINPFDPYAWRDLGNLLLNGGRRQEGDQALATAGKLAGRAGL